METNQTNDNDEGLIIDFSGLLKELWRKMALIVIVAVLTSGLAFAYASFYVTPIYQSSTTMYVLYQEEGKDISVYQGMVAGSYVISDYEQVIKSRYVLEQVIDRLDLTTSVGALAGKISISNPENTRFVKLTVTDTNPIRAMEIANEVRDIASEHIQYVMNAAAVNVVDEAYLPTYPVGPNVSKYTLFGAAAGFGVMVVIFALRFILNDALRTSEDIENRLGVSCLSVIPVNTGKVKRK